MTTATSHAEEKKNEIVIADKDERELDLAKVAALDAMNKEYTIVYGEIASLRFATNEEREVALKKLPQVTELYATIASAKLVSEVENKKVEAFKKLTEVKNAVKTEQFKQEMSAPVSAYPYSGVAFNEKFDVQQVRKWGLDEFAAFKKKTGKKPEAPYIVVFMREPQVIKTYVEKMIRKYEQINIK